MGDLDGTYLRQEAHAVDGLKLGYMPVHQKEGDEAIVRRGYVC